LNIIPSEILGPQWAVKGLVNGKKQVKKPSKIGSMMYNSIMEEDVYQNNVD